MKNQSLFIDTNDLSTQRIFYQSPVIFFSLVQHQILEKSDVLYLFVFMFI